MSGSDLNLSASSSERQPTLQSSGWHKGLMGVVKATALIAENAFS